ncbi:MAG: ECF transporter S component [Treponema sp.]|jgi:uncharacterized membrane protein|nr:ECF transporter S component [Treponema sp.]
MAITVKSMAVTGVLSAVVIVLGTTGLGFIVFPFGASITILQTPVIIGAILEGPFAGFFIGLLFGVFSIVQSALMAATPIDMAFVTYPYIAIVPRILIGPAAWLVYALISGQLKKPSAFAASSAVRPQAVNPVLESAAIIAAAITGSLVNTALVLSGFGIVRLFPWEAIIPVAIANGGLEAAGSAILVFLVATLWKRIPRGSGKSRISKNIEHDRS